MKPSSAIISSVRLSQTCYLLCLEVLGDRIVYNEIDTAIEEILTGQTTQGKSDRKKASITKEKTWMGGKNMKNFLT